MRKHLKLLLSLIALTITGFTFGDITNDVEQLRKDVSVLKSLLYTSQNSWYDWSTQSVKNTAGTQIAIVNTLRAFAKGVHDDILPEIQDIADGTTNLTAIAELLQRVADGQNTMADNVQSMMWAVLSLQYSMDYITTYLYDIKQDLDNISQYAFYLEPIYYELYSFKQSWELYSTTVLGYLNSIDNNVSSIAVNVEKGEGYLSDIYNSINAGINVSLLNGFPEPIDYSSMIEHMSTSSLWTHYEDWYQEVYKKYLAGGMRYRHYDDMSTNTVYQESVPLSGDFFTDTVSLLSNSDQTLADISKSLMLILQNSQSNNVSDVDIDSEAQDGVPTDKMDDHTDISSSLSFPTSSGHLTLPNVSSLDNKQFPTFIDYVIPHMMGFEGGTISINTGKLAPAFTTMRNICLFAYWGVTATLFVFLYKLFSKYVLGSLMKLAFSFVQKGKAV